MIRFRLLLLLLSLAFFSYSCNKVFEKDDTTKIKEAIESSLLEDMNNPDSYQFDQVRILDTLYVRDAYLHEIENLKGEVNSEKSLIQRSKRQIKEQEVSERLSTLREEFRVYGVNDQFDRIRNVITLYEQNNSSWIERLNDLEREIRKSSVQEYRYRNVLPLFEELRTLERNNAVYNAVIATSNERVNSIESEIQQLENYIESNEEKMNGIAFTRVIFSHREENIFGGVQLIRKVHEVRMKNDSVELMWDSENLESNESVQRAVEDLTYGKGIEIIKQENKII